MPGRISKTGIDFYQSKFMQISESHCGPAVIQMLLAYLGIDVTQEAVAEAGGATDLIEMNGMRVDQLARAVRVLAPQTRFWYKDHSRLKELVTIVRKYGFPVGVEWQGVFEDEEKKAAALSAPSADNGAETHPAKAVLPDSETEDEDFGHYSVVVHVRRRQRVLLIADPYKDYFNQARIFSFRKFNERWWDFNEVTDSRTGKEKLVEDYHMMFLITPRDRDFPNRFNMKMGK